MRIYGDAHPKIQGCIFVEVYSVVFAALLNRGLLVDRGIPSSGMHYQRHCFKPI